MIAPCTSTRKLSTTRKTVARVALVAGLLGLGIGSAQAIPSPDLVINLSASVAQLLGLLSVVFGGFAVRGKNKLKNAAKRGGSSRTTRYLFVGTAVCLLGAVAVNVLQYTGSIDAKNQRLQTNLVRKSVENGKAVGDVSLKTLSFSQQLDHQQGISTDTLAAWLDADVPVNIIDVREDEEYEVGAIKGAAHLRYPDVLSRSSVLPDKGEGKTLLICYSGNRSSELCGELEKQGKACNFMVGGYEKWLSEQRPMATDGEINAAELRKLPDFANKDVLLDTPDVNVLVAEERAEFVDVRYPEDYVADHLPGAHNITMRALSSAALTEKINALPDAPLIAACYDKRSCFYSTLIGLRIERAGKDFRGRYTVPHEYYAPSGSSVRAHVAAFQAEQQKTLASVVVDPLHALLDNLEGRTGHYAFALIAVVLMVRLLLLPLALKAERDTRVQKSLKGRVDKLKEELENHPRALGEATLALYKRYKIRPIINTLASVFQLGFMLLFYQAVSQGASGWADPLAWLPSAEAVDPLLILPLAASALFIGVLGLQIAPRTFRGRALLALGGAGLFWLLQSLGAAVNLYLAISMTFLVLQSVLFKAIGARLGWDTAGCQSSQPIENVGLVPLAVAHRLPDETGKKAARLGMLIEAGYDVPAGFVVTGEVTRRLAGEGETLSKQENRELDALWKSIGGGPVAVRSSGANEDGEEASFAGVYESILNVTREGLETALREVHASLDSTRSASYASASGQETDAETGKGGVVVQQMVPAEYAGVMFTEHPGTSGAMMVEMVTGLGEELVSGTVTPDTFAFGKLTGDRLTDDESTSVETPIDLGPLLAFGRELEVLFGQPQDIEWAYAKGKFRLLQARDITRSITLGDSPRNVAERERARLIKQLLGRRRMSRREENADAEAPVFVQNELSELLPRPTPLSADLMGRLWAADGSTDIACRDLGIPYNVHFRSVPYIVTVFGWMYVNKQEEQRRLGKGPSALATFRLARDAEEMARAFREDFLPGFRDEMVERNAIAVERLSVATAVELFDKWVTRFVEETYVEAERINIAADFHMKTALGKLAAADLDAGTFLADSGETVVTRAMSQLQGPNVSRANVEEFLALFGHRAPLDYELSEPRFEEDMGLVRQYIDRSRGNPVAHSTAVRDDQVIDVNDDGEIDEFAGLPADRILRVAVGRARDFMRLKEEAKHYCLLELAQIRSLLLSIDRQCKLDGRIFRLDINEVGALADEARRGELMRLADARMADATLYEALQPPTTLSIADLERVDMLTGQRPDAREPGELAGKRVAGEQTVTGCVRVITDVAAIETFEEGEILVARMTDPTWYPLFAKARGIVTEVGGWLSHAAIVAREYDLPAIVGVDNACRTLATGDVVTLNLDGSIEKVEKRRDSDVVDAAREGTDPMNLTTPESRTDAKVDTSDDMPANDVVQLTQAGRLPASDESDMVEETSADEGLTRDGNAVVIGHQRFQRAAERRAMKEQLSDRRSAPRVDANGDIQPDRRAANRVANAMQAFRMAS